MPRHDDFMNAFDSRHAAVPALDLPMPVPRTAAHVEIK
jgi:hypothetical protein